MTKQMEIIKAGFKEYTGRTIEERYMGHNARCAWKAAADCVARGGRALDSWRKFHAMPSLTGQGAAFERWKLAHYEMTVIAHDPR